MDAHRAAKKAGQSREQVLEQTVFSVKLMSLDFLIQGDTPNMFSIFKECNMIIDLRHSLRLPFEAPMQGVQTTDHRSHPRKKETRKPELGLVARKIRTQQVDWKTLRA